jgi:hypothetical protein
MQYQFATSTTNRGTAATLGHLTQQAGNHVDARRYWEQSLVVAEKIGVPLVEELRSWLSAPVEGLYRHENV